jgi:hypothetical protein
MAIEDYIEDILPADCARIQDFLHDHFSAHLVHDDDGCGVMCDVHARTVLRTP